MKKFRNIRDCRFEKMVIKIVLITGVILACLQFFLNRSLWRDEAKLALNILNKNSFELLLPLDYLQVAPILFLQTEKLLSQLIPNSEMGLRLFPLLCYLLSLFFFYKAIRLLHKNYYVIIFSLSLFVFNATLIYYSSELKQYIADVLVLTSVYYFLLKKDKKEEFKYYVLTAVGVVSIFLSNVAPIILLTAGLYLLYDNYKTQKKRVLNLIGVSFAWGSTFLFYFFVFIHNHPLRMRMLSFWSHGGFIPKNPFSHEFYEFLWVKAIMILKMNSGAALLPIFQRTYLHLIKIDALLIVLLLIGSIQLIKKRRFDIFLLTATPFIVQLILSAFKIYPFDTRLLLYTCPLIVVISSFGFKPIVKKLFSFLKIEKSAILALAIPLLLCYFLYRSGGFPIENVELKKSITYLKENIREKDKVFISTAVKPAFRYYTQTSFMELDANNIVFENRVSKDSIQFLKELGSLNGRVWFVFDSDFQYPVTYFEAKGKKAIQYFEAHNSAIYLYNIESPKVSSKLEATSISNSLSP